MTTNELPLASWSSSRAARIFGVALLSSLLGCASGSRSHGSGGQSSSGGSGGTSVAGSGGSEPGGSAGQGVGGTAGVATGGGGQAAAGVGGAPATGGAGGSAVTGGASGATAGNGAGGGVAGESPGGMGGQSNGGTAGEPASGAGGRSGGGTSAGTAGTGGMAPKPFAWTTETACPLARFEANGAVVDGELWVMGGFTGSNLNVTRRIDIYDPESDSWRRGPDLPGAETHIAVVTLGNDILIAGGFTGAFSGGSRPPTTDAVYRLPFGMTQWVAGPALPDRGAGFAWALLGTTLHLAGGLFADGNNDSPYHYVWDTAGAPMWTMAAQLPNPRNHGGGAAAGGLFYAVAGRHQWDEQAGNQTDVHAFDPGTGMWTQKAAIPTGRSEIGASTMALTDGRILVIGGSQNGIMPNDDVLLYAPGSNTWTPLPKLPAKRKGAVAAQLGERIVVTTGSPTSTDPIDTTYVGCCL